MKKQKNPDIFPYFPLPVSIKSELQNPAGTIK